MKEDQTLGSESLFLKSEWDFIKHWQSSHLGVREVFPMVASRQVDCKNWLLCEIASKLQGF